MPSASPSGGGILTTPSIDELEVGDLGADDRPEAVGVLARGMRDNPGPVAVFGDDPEERQRTLERLFGSLALAPAMPAAGSRIATGGALDHRRAVRWISTGGRASRSSARPTSSA